MEARPGLAVPDVPDVLEELWAMRDRDRVQVRQRLSGLPDSPHKSVLLAHLELRAGHFDAALSATEAVRWELPPGQWLARTLNIRAVILAEVGLWDAAHELFTEQLRVARLTADDASTLSALHDLGVFHMLRDPALSVKFLSQALERARDSGHLVTQMGALFNLAVVALGNHDHAAFAAHVQQLMTFPRSVDPDLYLLGRMLRCELALLDGDEAALSGALQELRARPDPGANGNQRLEVDLALLESRLDRRAGQPERAVERLQALLQHTQAELRALILEDLGEAQEQAGDLLGALRTSRELTAFWREFLGGQREQHVRTLEVLHHTEQAHLRAEQEVQRASELAGALERLRAAHEHIVELSLRDSLTGLNNRLYLLQRGPELLRPPAAQGATLSPGAQASVPAQLAMIDLDVFKAVNDTYGHAAGDALIIGVAGHLRAHLPPEDVVTRFGGDEFVVLRPAAGSNVSSGSAVPPGSLASALEEFRQQVAARRWPEAPVQITVSAGVVLVGDEALERALERADQFMYVAKRAGGNQVYAQLPGEQSGSGTSDGHEAGRDAKGG